MKIFSQRFEESQGERERESTRDGTEAVNRKYLKF